MLRRAVRIGESTLKFLHSNDASVDTRSGPGMACWRSDADAEVKREQADNLGGLPHRIRICPQPTTHR